MPAAAPEVVVVGAGPVGLTAAHELARRGLRVRLVDAAPAPAVTSRAVAVHPRTLETFTQMGVVDAMLPHGRKNRAFTMFAGGRRLVRLEADYSSMPTSHPYTLIVAQTDTEAVLRAAVARLGVQIEWNTRLTGFRQDTDGVHVRLTRADGTEESLRTSWLVGCDGGHSTVRKLLGLELIGTTSETWMLADAPVDTDLPPDTIYWTHTGRQALMMVPYARDGHWRLLDTAPRTGGTGAGAEAGAAARLSAKLSAGLGRRVRVGEPEWTSVFTFQQRMVPRMRVGRVFVAGDAAHVHSPASGQGMNTGIQEAYNLGWKLAQVHHRHAGSRLLDTYGEERVPVGRALLGSTRTATFLVQMKNLLASVALPAVFAVVRTVPALRRAIQRKVLGGMSGLRIAYRESSLTTAETREHLGWAAQGVVLATLPEHAPAPGERVTAGQVHDPAAPGCRALQDELRDPRWSLLFAPGGAHAGSDDAPDDTPDDVAVTAAVQYGEWLSVRTVEDDGGRTGPAPLPDPGGALRTALGLPPGGWLLVRPDGYVAARGALLTRAALRGALAPLAPSEPLAGMARLEPGLVLPAPTHRPKEQGA
ncbi:FAD-dependent oxidoreductase [Streptomyces sp. NPDC047130]|uniref:FAD-dependent oxidoreductase n=1 Tax=Streptomyces sp. NPDC047130 TaxID=3155261 RepID=UPI0033D0CD1D